VGWFLKGAIIGVLASFPLAALCALLFRFPIPFAGYQSGAGAVLPAMIAVLFYGVLGGFVVQGVLGGIGGVLGARLKSPDQRQVRARAWAFSVSAAAVGVLLLSVLDLLIGPW
jgi:hypothetical protein